MQQAKAFKTLQVRIKDRHAGVLRQMARNVNLVWNYVNELSARAIRERGQFLSAFEIHPYTKGAGKELGLHSQTLQCIAAEYVGRRRQFKKAKLKWRVSSPASPKRSLGWIPFNTGAASWKNGQVYHNGHYFGVWDSYGLGQYELRAGSFSEDSRGRWYFNVCVQVDQQQATGCDAVGIDLGLKASATTSDGDMLIGRQYRALEQKLGIAQRARKKSRARAIHAKIRNQRKDAAHKFSTMLAARYGAVFVGDASSKKLIKTKMAKSTLDAGWGQLKTMLEQKCRRAGVVFEVVDESYTTQVCSCCGSISASSPKGRAGLRIREWTCVDCGTAHDRDINAARNILAAGHRRLAVGIQPT